MSKPTRDRQPRTPRRLAGCGANDAGGGRARDYLLRVGANLTHHGADVIRPTPKRPHRARKSFTRFRAWAGTGRAANVTAIRQRSHDWSPTAWATRRSERGCSYPTAPSRTMSAASWT